MPRFLEHFINEVCVEKSLFKLRVLIFPCWVRSTDSVAQSAGRADVHKIWWALFYAIKVFFPSTYKHFIHSEYHICHNTNIKKISYWTMLGILTSISRSLGKIGWRVCDRPKRSLQRRDAILFGDLIHMLWLRISYITTSYWVDYFILKGRRIEAQM